MGNRDPRVLELGLWSAIERGHTEKKKKTVEQFPQFSQEMELFYCVSSETGGMSQAGDFFHSY